MKGVGGRSALTAAHAGDKSSGDVVRHKQAVRYGRCRVGRRRNWFRYGHLGIESVPRDVTGLYSFWCRVPRKCIYVGKTRRPIRHRLREHFGGSHNKKLNRWIRCFGNDLLVCWAEVPDGRLDTLEKLFIRKWRPLTNDQMKSA